MARRVFFSFHYQRDVQRANVVKNSWVTRDREEAGFFDSSAFEQALRTSSDALKRFLNRELNGSSVTCVLIGAETAYRRWVRYEIVRSLVDGKGLLGVRINGIQDFFRRTDPYGDNPFALLGYERRNGSISFKEFSPDQGTWVWYNDLPSVKEADMAYPLGPASNVTLDKLFPVWDWQTNGYQNLGTWVEMAAQAAGR